MAEDKHVVIVGAGFAGLQAAKKLGNKKGIKVTVVDKNNHHLNHMKNDTISSHSL